MEKFEITKEQLVELVDKASTEKATGMVAAALDLKVKELGLDKAAENKFAFKGSYGALNDDERSKLDSKAKMVSFIKALYNKDTQSLAAFKAMNEGTGSAGGYVVPEEFAAEVNRVVEDFGLVAKMARKFPMNSDTLNIPRLASSVSVTWPGEAVAGTGSQPVLEQVQLLSKSLIGLTPMSNELLADANISVVDLLVELFAEAIAGETDNQGLAGSGSPFTGILNDTGVTVETAASGDTTFTKCATPAYARKLIADVKPWSLQGAAFIMHRSVWALMQVVRVGDTTGDYFAASANAIMSNSGAQGFPTAVAGTLWGYPVYLSDKMPTSTAISTKFIIFGNLKHIFLGQRADMVVSVSQDGTIGGVSLFETNQSAVRVVSRLALAVGLPKAFAVLKTAAS